MKLVKNAQVYILDHTLNKPHSKNEHYGLLGRDNQRLQTIFQTCSQIYICVQEFHLESPYFSSVLLYYLNEYKVSEKVLLDATSYKLKH